MWCDVMDCPVDVEDGRCKKRIGTSSNFLSCPNEGSLICPLKKGGSVEV